MIPTREITANGLAFTCREAGTSGERVILLHGFPETSHMWTKLMPRLVEAGYRCLAPDQRGYSTGARPASVEQYRYEDISDDPELLDYLRKVKSGEIKPTFGGKPKDLSRIISSHKA